MITLYSRSFHKLIRYIKHVLCKVEDTYSCCYTRDDKRPETVYESYLPHDDEERNSTSFSAYRHRCDNERKELCAPRESVLGKCKSRQSTEEERRDCSEYRGECTVEEVVHDRDKLEKP